MYEQTLDRIEMFLNQWKIKNILMQDVDSLLEKWCNIYGEDKESLDNFYKGYTKSIGLGNPWKDKGDFA